MERNAPKALQRSQLEDFIEIFYQVAVEVDDLKVGKSQERLKQILSIILHTIRNAPFVLKPT